MSRFMAKTPEKFIEEAMSVHGDKYDYTKVIYINTNSKVDIRCKKHGWFQQTPAAHLVGKGCRICGHESSAAAKRSNTEIFVQKAKNRYGEKYNYSKTVYVNNRTKFEIICSVHNRSFWQTAHQHLVGDGGCPLCLLEDNRGMTHVSWKGCGELSRDHWSVIRRGAEKRKIEFNISIEYAWDLFLQQNCKCAVTGCPLQMHIPGGKTTNNRCGRKKGTWTASLDRIDNSKGYVIGNVQWVHVDINLMKLHHTTQRFYELCYAVVHYRQQQTMSAGK